MSALPITLADPHKGLTPTAYVLRMKCQHCQRCGYFFESLDGVFAETWLRPTGAEGQSTGRPFKNYRPLGDQPPMFNIPIRAERMQVQKLPFCSECCQGALSHLPQPKGEGRIVGNFNSSYAQSLISPRGSTTKVKRASGTGAPKKAPATLDELAKDLDL